MYYYCTKQLTPFPCTVGSITHHRLTLMYKVPDKTSYLYLALLTSFPGPTTWSPCSCQNWNLWLSSLLGQGKMAVSPTSTCWTVIWLRTESNTVAHMLNTTAAVAPIVCKKTLLQNYNSLIAWENDHTVFSILLGSACLTCVNMKHKSSDKIWQTLHLWPK